MNILSIIIGVIILGFALKGLKNGLVMTVCSFVMVFIAMAVTQILTPQVTQIIRSNDSIMTSLSSQISDVVFSDDKEDEDIQDEQNVEDEEIDQLSVPKLMKDQLIKNNNQETYNSLGVTTLQDYICLYIAYSLINCITYVVMFAIVMVLLNIIARILNIVSKLPVINTLNKFGGFAIGTAEGLLFTWVLFILFVAIANTALGNVIYNQIEDSIWLSYLYDNNLILRALTTVMKGLF